MQVICSRSRRHSELVVFSGDGLCSGSGLGHPLITESHVGECPMTLRLFSQRLPARSMTARRQMICYSRD
ncbi:hypothetical protein TIFTF001_014903 [Ficus carica]|uniref:Uncharacterized protein n=1 Tax=Ficus carica TaxID=3494 RepID=A0AA88D615_FICCA|nr:hypothetical protein TIFTF001_014903 [Ficus carica]